MNAPTAAALLNPSWNEPIDKNKVLQQWLDAKQQLDAAKALEQSLRTQVIGLFAFNPKKKEGVEYLDLAQGYRLKAQKSLRYVLDKEATDKALDLIEQEGETGKFIAERLVKWMPTLSVSEYRSLPDVYRTIIDEALTTKEALPTLELIEPAK